MFLIICNYWLLLTAYEHLNSLQVTGYSLQVTVYSLQFWCRLTATDFDVCCKLTAVDSFFMKFRIKIYHHKLAAHTAISRAERDTKTVNCNL